MACERECGCAGCAPGAAAQKRTSLPCQVWSILLTWPLTKRTTLPIEIDMGRTPTRYEIIGLRYTSNCRFKLCFSGELKSRMACKPRSKHTQTARPQKEETHRHEVRCAPSRGGASYANLFEGAQHGDAPRIGAGNAVIAELHHQPELDKRWMDRHWARRGAASVSSPNPGAQGGR